MKEYDIGLPECDNFTLYSTIERDCVALTDNCYKVLNSRLPKKYKAVQYDA